jgi:hypothetical protein
MEKGDFPHRRTIRCDFVIKSGSWNDLYLSQELPILVEAVSFIVPRYSEGGVLHESALKWDIDHQITRKNKILSSCWTSPSFTTPINTLGSTSAKA